MLVRQASLRVGRVAGYRLTCTHVDDPARSRTVPAPAIIFVYDVTSVKSYKSVRKWIRELAQVDSERPDGICSKVIYRCPLWMPMVVRVCACVLRHQRRRRVPAARMKTTHRVWTLCPGFMDLNRR